MTTARAPIRTPDQRLRIFVSSTLGELAEEREAVKEAIQRIHLTPVMFELGARAHPPRDLYRAYLDQSDVFVGIYWQKYGWIAPTETISGLEDEYRLAAKKPKLIYIKRADAREERLAALIEDIQRGDQVSYRPFRDAEELKTLVANDLATMLTERFAASVASANTDRGDEGVADDAPPRWLPPVERGELIGRDDVLARVAELLSKPDTECLTLTGPGGTGKTRLAVHAAHEFAARFDDGAYYVPLAAVRAAADVVPTIGTVLEVPTPQGGGDPEKLLVAFLRARRALVVLDNFEQVLDAAGDVARVLAACPHLKLLVTSREALRIKGERELPVPPLPHDPRVAGTSSVTPAMKLFEQRAKEIRPDFAIDDENRADVAEICRRLDALPLAIELAASRVRVLSPQAMLPRLDKSLALLTSGRRDLPARQQTLRGALDWSHDLLSPDERVFFRRLGVFTGDFAEDAAAAVVGEAALDPLDGLTSLVEKSLLVRRDDEREPRFAMLETVRAYALDKLAAAGEERAARMRHAEWVTTLLGASRGILTHASERFRVLERFAREDGNIRAAQRFLAGPDGDREAAWRLYCHYALARHAELRGREVWDAYAALRAGGPATDPYTEKLARGLAAWATAWVPQPFTLDDLRDAVAALEAAGDRTYLPALTAALATVMNNIQAVDALPVLDRAIALAVEERQHMIESWARMIRVLHFLMRGDGAQAERAADDLIATSATHGEQEGIAFGMTSKGRLALMRGDLAAARTFFADATVYARARSGVYARADSLQCLASTALAQGDEAGARAIVEELVLFSATRNGVTSFEIAWGALAWFLAASGERERAARVLAVVPRGVEQAPPTVSMQRDPTGALTKATAEARALLGDPPPLDPEKVDVQAALRAALGPRATT